MKSIKPEIQCSSRGWGKGSKLPIMNYSEKKETASATISFPGFQFKQESQPTLTHTVLRETDRCLVFINDSKQQVDQKQTDIWQESLILFLFLLLRAAAAAAAVVKRSSSTNISSSRYNNCRPDSFQSNHLPSSRIKMLNQHYTVGRCSQKD